VVFERIRVVGVVVMEDARKQDATTRVYALTFFPISVSEHAMKIHIMTLKQLQMQV
jgi:hypothetical protein